MLDLEHEDIYIRDYETVPDLYQGLECYFAFYNEERPHQALNYKTPKEVHGQRGSKEGNRNELR